MITCEWMARLGNNMFQIAATYALANKYKDNAEFTAHPDFPWLPKRSHEVENIFIAPDKINEVYDIPHKKNMTISGFFQRHEYFDNIKEQLIKEVFRVPEDWQPNVCAIHVRRGDFLFDTSGCFPVIPKEYIEKAMQIIGNKKFVFCSDDIQWCKENFPNFEFRENTKGIDDIYFMANCDSVIMSNSTFSFWGAYLNLRYRDIVFPLNWFGKGKRNGYEICPKNWKGI